MTNRRFFAVVCTAVLLGAPLTGLTLQAGAQSATPGAPKSEAASANTVEAWGDNSAGELGNGSLQEAGTPVALSGLGSVSAVSAGDRFTLALLHNGTVVAWGNNSFGQLGNGTTTYSARPVAVEGLSGVTAVAAGGGHSLALLKSGTVMAWGDNLYGQLGNGSTVGSDVPVAVSGLSGVTAIAAGSLHSMALLSNGTIDTWGDNGDGQLGQGNFANADSPVPVGKVSGVTQVAAGGEFSLVLEQGGTVQAWGDGELGQLGDGGTTASTRPVTVSDLTGVQQISAGWDHALALMGDGTVMVWGDDTFGQLDNPPPPLAPLQSDVPEPALNISGATAVAAGGYFSLAQLTNGTVEAWGDDALDQLGAGTSDAGSGPVVVTGLSGVTAIAAGGSHAVALTASAGSASSHPQSEAQPSIWQDVASPNPGAPPAPELSDTLFSAISAASSTDAWAVGQIVVGLTTRAVAASWNGSSWTAAVLPAVPGQSTLVSVADLAPGNAWAVGRTVVGGRTETLTEHWNGTTWAVVTSPDPAGGSAGLNELGAVTGIAPGNVWAFGDDVENGILRLLYLHLVNGSWQVVSGPNVGVAFSAATAISANDIWAVGDSATTTFSVEWNGTSWVDVPTPFLRDGTNPDNLLTGVSASGPSDIWASGYEDNVDNENLRTPYVLHNTGSGWTLVTVPNLGSEGSLLHGLTAVSSTDVWAVGQTEEFDGAILTLTEQYNGTTWTVQPSLDPGENGPLPDGSLFGISSGGSGKLVTVGAQEELGMCCTETLSQSTNKG